MMYSTVVKVAASQLALLAIVATAVCVTGQPTKEFALGCEIFAGLWVGIALLACLFARFGKRA